MRFTILNVAYPFAPVGPDVTGRAEQVLSSLDFALHEHGRESLVVASESSATAGRPEKNFHVALEAARRAGIACLLGGGIFPYPAHQEYFRTEILPRLDGRRRYLGSLSCFKKRWILGGALCLLIPSLAPETSSLVAMEAMASGTPVIAFPSGALPEIVEHGRTGFPVRDEREMAEAISAVPTIDRERCREAARRRFDRGRFVARYLELYRNLIAQNTETHAA